MMLFCYGQSSLRHGAVARPLGRAPVVETKPSLTVGLLPHDAEVVISNHETAKNWNHRCARYCR
jgi:hypothetical protein